MSLDSGVRDKIIASVEAGFADQLEFTRQMIRFPSVRGAEHTVQDFVFRELSDRGYAMDRFRDGPGRHREPPRRFAVVGRSIPPLLSSWESIGRATRPGARSFCRRMWMSSRPDRPRCGRMLPSIR